MEDFLSKNIGSTIIKLFHENPLSVKILSETKRAGFLQAQSPQFVMPLLFWIDCTIPQGAIPSQESTPWGGRQQKATKNHVYTEIHTQSVFSSKILLFSCSTYGCSHTFLQGWLKFLLITVRPQTHFWITQFSN